MMKIRTLFIVMLAFLIAACSSGSTSNVASSRSVSGSVLAPQLSLAQLQHDSPGLLARVLGLFSTTSWADISGTVGGFVPVSGVTVELVRLNYDPVSNTLTETSIACDGGCPVTAADGSFTIYTSEVAATDLAMKVSFIDPVDGVTPIVMRAMVYGNNVNVTPISEAATQIVTNSLSQYVPLNYYTPNEIGSLVSLIEDEDIDISGLNFTDALSKITTDAGDLLSGFISGFQTAGEMNVAYANDVFHIVELRNRLIAPNGTFAEGAVDYETTTGGAVSFDQNGDFQSGSALYYWGLRSSFSDSPVLPYRLFDQALDQLSQDPNSPGYGVLLGYGLSVGFRGITVGSNGMAVANSDTELTTYGFLSNDGGIGALLSEKNDEAQSIYDRGLRVLLRKWKDYTNNYNATFTNDTINYNDGINGTNNNNTTTATTSQFLNPLMDQATYNVVAYQHYMNDTGMELGSGAGSWSFDTSLGQVAIASSSGNEYYGTVTVSSQNLDAAQYQYANGTLTTPAIKAIEPCPNLFAINYGGTLLLRRDAANVACNGVAADVFAGSGAVTADGGVFVVPQVYDDSEDDVQLELPMPVGAAARRGWYVGVKQPATALANANVNGIYHVVGQVTEVDDSIDSISHETFYGTVQFYSGLVSGTLHRKTATLDRIDPLDGMTPILSRTPSTRDSFVDAGTYSVAADGTVAVTIPGTTDAVTGAAGQVYDFNDPTKDNIAMFLAIPIKRDSAGKSARGIMLLAHEFLVNYPVPPDPPLP